MVQLFGRIGTAFIEEAVLFLPDFRQFHWLIIRQPSEAAAVERPFPVLRGQFLDGLGHDERPFPHMVEFPVPFRTQACIAAVDEPGVAEFLEGRLFQGLQGLLFVLVPREDGKGQGDAVPIREHPHLYDRVRSVPLALPIFFASVFLLYLKVIVRAVVVKDAVIPVYLEVAVLIGFRLYEVALGGKHVQGAVDIMLLIGRLFEIVHCCPVGGAFASRLQYPGIDQARQYGIQVILELMPAPDLPADAVESESVIDGLEEKVSAFIKFLAAIIQLSVSVERHKDCPCLFFFFIVLCFQSGLLPRPLHHAVPVSAERFGKFLEGAEFPDSFGSAPAIAVYVGLGYIKGFRIFRFRCRYFHVVLPPYSVSLYITIYCNRKFDKKIQALCGL